MAALSSKLGFSVVAPTSVTVPSSTTPRKPSCCARLKRWISSTNSRVFCPARAASRASANSFFSSATPENTAEMPTKRRPTASASSRAMLVLPVPGGPQRMRLDSVPAATMRPMAPSGPVRCDWPTTSDSARGRRRSASGGFGAGAGAASPPNRSAMGRPSALEPGLDLALQLDGQRHAITIAAVAGGNRTQPSETQYSSTLVRSTPSKRMPTPRSSSAPS